MCLLFAVSSYAIPPTFVPADSSTFEYLGAWQNMTTHVATAYAGSQFRFALSGKACLRFLPPNHGTLRLKIQKDGNEIWNDVLQTDAIEVDGGEAFSSFSIVYLTSSAMRFDASNPPAASLLQFSGCNLAHDAGIRAPDKTRNGLSLAFIGDSITCGTCILGRQGDWSVHSDATRTYAFRLADALESNYLMWGIPGGKASSFSGLFGQALSSPSSRPPDLVFINLGANQRIHSEARFREGMRQLARGILLTYPETHIVLLNFMRMTPDRLPMFKSLAREFPVGKVSTFDARPFLVGYADDGVHPDEESHRRLGTALAEQVKAHMQSTGTEINGENSLPRRHE